MLSPQNKTIYGTKIYRPFMTQSLPLFNTVKVGSQSYMAGLSQSFQKSISSAHTLTK